MSNGYFRLVDADNGYGILLVPPTEDGEKVTLSEVMAYLDKFKMDYDLKALKEAVESGAEGSVFLGAGSYPTRNEEYVMVISPDRMQVTVRFHAPSEHGSRMSINEFMKDLRFKGIVHGIDMRVLQDHFQGGEDFCTDLVVAVGKPPRHGSDASIEYFFNTDVHIQPTVREDGSVDFFHLNMINHCKMGDLLAKIVPADLGEAGIDVYGKRVKPRDVKRKSLNFGNNITLSEDRLSITSQVDGHVMLVEDKVFVSDVYEVENVDLSTGNIEFQGSVKVNGNVVDNMRVVAGGNVIINGVVEGAYVEAGGNIIIARGMNGMAKGCLKAGGNVIAKFLENSFVTAEGYVNTESILHSNISAGTEVTVTGKKGFITGGHVQAGNRIAAKTLGATMGAATVVEVGGNPKLKAEYVRLQREVMEIVRLIRNAQPIIMNYTEKRNRGVRFSEEQVQYVKDAVNLVEVKKKELEERNLLMKDLATQFDAHLNAEVVAEGMVYPGTNIVIGDLSMTVHNECRYCKFVKKNGDVKAVPLV